MLLEPPVFVIEAPARWGGTAGRVKFSVAAVIKATRTRRHRGGRSFAAKMRSKARLPPRREPRYWFVHKKLLISANFILSQFHHHLVPAA